MTCRCLIPGQLLAECECHGLDHECARCAGTGLRPAPRVRARLEPAAAVPCPTHAPDDYRIWLARGSSRWPGTCHPRS
ncbi:MAG: hypothetical protein IPK07_26350 [Deltaproteobacteria bacterium]|nr:hypothetical protein [Deltaproteobacteria bacterium]